MKEELKGKTWPLMHRDIQMFLDTCVCSLEKENRKGRKTAFFNPADKSGLMAIDLYSFEQRTFLTIMNLETKEIWILPVEGKSKEEVGAVFKRLVEFTR
jgi:hypothetical protein